MISLAHIAESLVCAILFVLLFVLVKLSECTWTSTVAAWRCLIESPLRDFIDYFKTHSSNTILILKDIIINNNAAHKGFRLCTYERYKFKKNVPKNVNVSFT